MVDITIVHGAYNGVLYIKQLGTGGPHVFLLCVAELFRFSVDIGACGAMVILEFRAYEPPKPLGRYQ